MSTITITKLYDQLSAVWGKETAENLTTFIDCKMDNDLKKLTPSLATKEDMANTVAKLEVKINESKTETIRWMFVFWLGQMVTTFGFILLFLRK